MLSGPKAPPGEHILMYFDPEFANVRSGKTARNSMEGEGERKLELLIL